MIVSKIDTIHNTDDGYEITCIWNLKYNVHVHIYMIQTNVDIIFQKLVLALLFLFPVDFIAKIQCTRVEKCSSCFVYEIV